MTLGQAISAAVTHASRSASHTATPVQGVADDKPSPASEKARGELGVAETDIFGSDSESVD